VERRLAEVEARRGANEIRPEVEWAGDGYITCTIFLPEREEVAEAAALEIAARMGLQENEVIHKRVMHPAEGTLVEIKELFPLPSTGTACAFRKSRSSYRKRKSGRRLPGVP